MTVYELIYQDDRREQFRDSVDAQSPREAAQKSVSNDSKVPPAQQDQFTIRVYPAGDPESDSQFKYEEFV